RLTGKFCEVRWIFCVNRSYRPWKKEIRLGEAAILYTRCPGYATANLGEEIAVLDLDGGSYLGFNVTASEVWRFLEVPRTVDSVCSHLTEAFDVDESQCRVAVANLLGRLSAAG